MAAGENSLSRSMTLSEIRSFVELRMPKEERDTEGIVAAMEQNGLLEESVESESAWEVPHAVAEFIRHLSSRQRLTSPDRISAILSEIARQTALLHDAFSSMDKDAAIHAWKILQQGLEDARCISKANHEAILQNIMAIKSKSDNRSLRERFLFIQELHSRYLSVLGVIVDVGGEMDQRLTELIGVIKHGAGAMGNEPGVPEMSEKMLFLIKRLREDAWTHYHSAIKEVAPLFKQIRHDHGLASSASRVLELVGKNGAVALKPVVEQVKVSKWYEENLFSNYPLEDYVGGVREYTRRPDLGPLSVGIEESIPVLLDEQALCAEVEELGHIPDFLKWIFERYDGYDEHSLINAFHNSLMKNTYATKVSGDKARVDTARSSFQYNPVTIYEP
ncbi:MAG: hypothetical protein HY937_03415 [Nitrosomonadales bacterium]|nr:hypothetical protein [Nitrosomonadales bacterium]